MDKTVNSETVETQLRFESKGGDPDHVLQLDLSGGIEGIKKTIDHLAPEDLPVLIETLAELAAKVDIAGQYALKRAFIEAAKIKELISGPVKGQA